MKISDGTQDDAESALNLWFDDRPTARSRAIPHVREIIEGHTASEAAYIAAYVMNNSTLYKASAFLAWLEGGMPDEWPSGSTE